MKSFKEWLLLTEGKQFTYVYHVSPESDLYKIRPTGKHSGTHVEDQDSMGIYVAPKFRNAVAWFVSYVMGKKRRTQDKKRSKRVQELGIGFHDDPFYYRTATIYKIQIPKDILSKSWYNNFWEPEYFIEDKYLDQIKIVSSKTYRAQELVDLYSRHNRAAFDARSKDTTHEAKKSRNLAAKVYLHYKEKAAQAALKGKQFNKEAVSSLLSSLTRYFQKDMWFDIKPMDEKEIEKIRQQLSHYLG